mmetsp:Transcript_117658/g.374903  ORF Transcript_117658/g.374903 Transcript_117658/m.374903 type:complete len:169 (+) Transcript_117658:254-760(+)
MGISFNTWNRSSWASLKLIKRKGSTALQSDSLGLERDGATRCANATSSLSGAGRDQKLVPPSAVTFAPHHHKTLSCSLPVRHVLPPALRNGLPFHRSFSSAGRYITRRVAAAAKAKPSVPAAGQNVPYEVSQVRRAGGPSSLDASSAVCSGRDSGLKTQGTSQLNFGG